MRGGGATGLQRYGDCGEGGGWVGCDGAGGLGREFEVMPIKA
jgi:hypothetical protein